MMSSSSAKSGINAAAGDPSPSRAAPDPKSSDMFRYNIFKNVGITGSTKEVLENTLADLSVADSKHDFTHGLKSITNKLDLIPGDKVSNESKMYQRGIPVNYTHYLDEDKALSTVVVPNTFKFDNTDIIDTTDITTSGYTPYKVVDCLKTGNNALIKKSVKHTFTTINGNIYSGTFIDVKPAEMSKGVDSDGNYKTTKKGALISGKKLLKAMGYDENYNGSICFGVDCVSINLETIFNTPEPGTTVTGFDNTNTKLFLALTRAKFNDPGGQTNVKSTTFRSTKGINYKPLVPFDIENSDSYGYSDVDNKLPADSFFTNYRFNLSLELKLTVPCFSSYKSTLQINPSHLEKIKPTIIPNSGYMNEINEVIKIILDVIAKIRGNPTNIDAFNFNCGYQGKRSGDWLQALAVAEMCLGLTKYTEYNVNSRISFIDMFKKKNFEDFLTGDIVDTSDTWLITHDRLLFAFGLLLGLNMILTHHYKKSKDDACSYHSAIIYKIADPGEMRRRKETFLTETYAKIIVGNGTVSFLANDIGNLLKRFKETETEVSKKLNGTQKDLDTPLLRYGLIGQLNEKIVDATTKFNPDGRTGKILKTDVETLTQSIFSLAFEISMIKETFPDLGVVDAEAQDFIQRFTQLNTNINMGGPDIVMDSGEPVGLRIKDGSIYTYEDLSKLMSTYYSLKAKYEGLITKNQDETQKFLSGYSKNLKNNPAFSLISKWTASDKPKNNLWVLAKGIFSDNASFINDKNVFLYKLTKLDDDLKNIIFGLYLGLYTRVVSNADIIEAGRSSLAAKTRENILSFCVEVMINLATGDTAVQVTTHLSEYLAAAADAANATAAAAEKEKKELEASSSSSSAVAAVDPDTNRILNPVAELNDLTMLGPEPPPAAAGVEPDDYIMGTITLPITDTTRAAPVLALAAAVEEPPPVAPPVLEVSQFVLQDAVEKLMSIKAILGENIATVTDGIVDTKLGQLVGSTDGYKTIDLIGASHEEKERAAGTAAEKINSLRAVNDLKDEGGNNLVDEKGIPVNNGEAMIGGNNKLHYNTTFSIDNKEVPRTIILANLFALNNGSVEAIIDYVTDVKNISDFTTDEDIIEQQTELESKHSKILKYENPDAQALINIDRVPPPAGMKVGGPSSSSSINTAADTTAYVPGTKVGGPSSVSETKLYITMETDGFVKINETEKTFELDVDGKTIEGTVVNDKNGQKVVFFVIKANDKTGQLYYCFRSENSYGKNIDGYTEPGTGVTQIGETNPLIIYSVEEVEINKKYYYFIVEDEDENRVYVVSKIEDFWYLLERGKGPKKMITLKKPPPSGGSRLQKGGAIKEEIDELIQKPENILKGEKFGSQPLTPIYLLLESFCFELNVSDIESSWDYEIFTQFFVIVNKLIYELTNKYLKEQDGESNVQKNTNKLKALVNGYGLRELIYTSPQYIERDDVCKKVLNLDNSSDDSYGLLSKVFSLLVNRVCGSIHQSDEEITQSTKYIDNPIFIEYVKDINFQEILDSNVQYEKAFEMSLDATKLFLKVGDCITLDIYGNPSNQAYQELLQMTESAQSKYLLPNDSVSSVLGLDSLVGKKIVNKLGEVIGDVTTDYKNFTDAVTSEAREKPVEEETDSKGTPIPIYGDNQSQIMNAMRLNNPSNQGYGIRVGFGGNTRKMRIVKVPKITRNKKIRKRKQTRKQTRKPRRKQTRRTNKRTRKHRN